MFAPQDERDCDVCARPEESGALSDGCLEGFERFNFTWHFTREVGMQKHVVRAPGLYLALRQLVEVADP